MRVLARRTLVTSLLALAAACNSQSMLSLEQRAPAPEPSLDASVAFERMLELTLKDSRVQDHLRHLTRVVGPRLTGSHGLMEAEAWCRGQFASWGRRFFGRGKTAAGLDSEPNESYGLLKSGGDGRQRTTLAGPRA